MQTPIIPIPRSPVTVRPATAADLPFIDSLQKLHSKQVGWMPMKSLEQKIASGSVLIAEEDLPRRHEATKVCSDAEPPFVPSCLRGENLDRAPVGYVISTDRYMKREDCGIIYQVNVAPARQRGLIGATLVRAALARAAYGCRLFCCWCAQDIEANRFWESLGFIPLAYRAGSREKGRVHIFWQRRVRADDATTPYWFPSQTTGGSIREDRLVFPIPPGVGWREAMPVVLPERSEVWMERSEVRGQRSARAHLNSDLRPPTSSSQRALPGKRGRPQHSMPFPPRSCISSGGLRLPPPKPVEPEPKPEPAPKQKFRNAPRLVAAARELRDRYLEHVNGGQRQPASSGKYDVTRRQPLEGPMKTRLLPNPRAA